MTGKIHSIETFGTVDGPGVRFVVFFQGCPMRCKFCHNPDTWDMEDAQHEMSAEEIIARMERNLPFYKGGGITATGGEPLMQMNFLTELFRLAKSLGIHTALDTSGFGFKNEPKIRAKFDTLLALTDLVMLDIKHASEDAHKALTGHSGESAKEFARYLSERGHKMRIRHVLIPNITDDDEQLLALGKFIGTLRGIEKIEVLPYHKLGVVKYEQLGIPYPLSGTPALTDADAKRALEIIKSACNG